MSARTTSPGYPSGSAASLRAGGSRGTVAGCAQPGTSGRDRRPTCCRSASSPPLSPVPARCGSGCGCPGSTRATPRSAAGGWATRLPSRGSCRTATAPGSWRRSARGSTPHGSADGCGCGAPSPTGRRARRRSTPSSRPTPPWTCRTASATSSAPASASPGSPRTGQCSGMDRSPVASCSCTASGAGWARWPHSWPAGPAGPWSAPSAAAPTWTGSTRPGCRTRSRSTPRTLSSGSGRWPRTASTGSWRCRCRTTPTSTSPSWQSAGCSPPTPAATTGRRCPSGRCSSATSRCACSAATTSRPRRSGRRPPT